MREILSVEPNVPVQVSLAYSMGRQVEARKGVHRMMYTLVGDKVMFLDLDVSKKIEDLRIKPRQPFYIRKEVSGVKGEIPTWRVWLPETPCGEQPDGTFAVPTIPERDLPIAAPAKTHMTTSSNGSNGRAKPIESTDSLFRAKALIDLYAAALAYATKTYPDQVTPEDVRALVLQAAREGSR